MIGDVWKAIRKSCTARYTYTYEWWIKFPGMGPNHTVLCCLCFRLNSAILERIYLLYQFLRGTGNTNAIADIFGITYKSLICAMRRMWILDEGGEHFPVTFFLSATSTAVTHIAHFEPNYYFHC